MVGTALALTGMALGALAGALVAARVADDQDRVDALSRRVAGLEREIEDVRAAAAEDVVEARTAAEREAAEEYAARKAELDARAAALDDREAEVARLAALGAVRRNDMVMDDGWTWTVMVDPDGNELCVTDP